MTEHLDRVLERLFASDSEIYQQRGFQRRVASVSVPRSCTSTSPTRGPGPATRSAVTAWTPSSRRCSASTPRPRPAGVPIVYTTTAYQQPTSPNSDTGLWHRRSRSRCSARARRKIDERIAPHQPGDQVMVKQRASAFHGT
jgi:hypothetical protein